MSFCFKWPKFDNAFVEKAREELEMALNRGAKPSNICDTIQVKTLNMGSEAPELDILEIGELNEEKFRGIFKITYVGDAHVILQTKIQANPLSLGSNSDNMEHLLGPSMVAADAPLVVPLELRISQVRIRGIFVLIVSLSRGVTISFKNDPLESVQVNSTFDTVPSIRNHLQKEIEQLLRDLFREDLPLLIHQHSLDKIREFAERIPPTFRASPPLPGHFRHRRTQSTSAPIPSRTNSPANGNAVAENGNKSNAIGYDEVYYFRRSNMVHRTIGEYSTYDPLTEAMSRDLQSHHRSFHECLKGLWHQFVGSPTQSMIEASRHLQGSIASKKEGLNDPMLFKAMGSSRQSRFGSQTIVINSGIIQVDLSAETINSLNTVTGEMTLRKPSVYKAPRSKSKEENESVDGKSPSILDPEEFRSVDSLLLRSYTNINSIKPVRSIASSAAFLSKSVLQSSLEDRLKILRSLQERPSPFDFPVDSNHIIHRSQSFSRP